SRAGSPNAVISVATKDFRPVLDTFCLVEPDLGRVWAEFHAISRGSGGVGEMVLLLLIPWKLRLELFFRRLRGRETKNPLKSMTSPSPSNAFCSQMRGRKPPLSR